MSGVFITFEGGEGSGKSTQMQRAAEVLKKISPFPVTATREPGGTRVGEAVRDILLGAQDPIAPACELALFAAARAQLVSTILRPALNRGYWVLCDRYVDSTVAYQGARGISRVDIDNSIAMATAGLMPDITFWLDVDPQVGLERVARRMQLNRIDAEALEFHKKVRANYLALASRNPDRIMVIDANVSVDVVHYEIMRKIVNWREGKTSVL